MVYLPTSPVCMLQYCTAPPPRRDTPDPWMVASDVNRPLIFPKKRHRPPLHASAQGSQTAGTAGTAGHRARGGRSHAGDGFAKDVAESAVLCLTGFVGE